MYNRDLKDRTKNFALRVMKLVNALPSKNRGYLIGNQLFRAGTSVGANYRAFAELDQQMNLLLSFV
jgi:four helix bundle protein